MSRTLTADLARILARELTTLREEVLRFPDDAMLWGVVPGITNSAGTLALHVAGSLRHFVGAVLGGSGYVRDRAAEFADRGRTRAEVAEVLRQAEFEVVTALDGLDPARLSDVLPVPVAGVHPPAGRFLVHLAAHTGFHLGQVGYLRRVLTGDASSTEPLAVSQIVDPT